MSDATAAAVRFDDSDAYERFMGAWSRAAVPRFCDWLAPPAHARWLDVGCGTAILSAHVLAHWRPRSIVAIDPAAAQVEHAARQLRSADVRFHVASAEALPFADGSFDVVASALVINFIEDRPAALEEMRRVTRSGGMVAGFIWDLAAEGSPSGPLRRALRSLGLTPPDVPGTSQSTIAALRGLFTDAGLRDVSTCSFEVRVSHPDFETFWQAQTPAFTATTRLIRALDETTRAELKAALRTSLAAADGSIAYASRVNGVRGQTPFIAA